MWEYLQFHESVRIVIIAVILLPMIFVGAFFRRKEHVRPYNRRLGMLAHFYSIAIAVALVLGDYYVGYFEFGMLTYVVGVSFSLLLILTYVIICVVTIKKYKQSFIDLK